MAKLSLDMVEIISIITVETSGCDCEGLERWSEHGRELDCAFMCNRDQDERVGGTGASL